MRPNSEEVEIVDNLKPYKVDGEVGRFEFVTHSLFNQEQTVCVYDTSSDLFPGLKTNEFYKTTGFKDIAMVYGNTEDSYRKTAGFINRIRHQQEGGTPYRTLQENTEKEGMQLIEHISEKSTEILKENEFTEKGEYVGHNELYKNDMPISIPLEEIKKAAQNLKTDLDINEMFENPVIYEDSQHSVNIAIDDVNVKKQEETRDRNPKEDNVTKRKYVHNTVTHIENDNKKYVLNGYGLKSVLLILIAFIFNNNLVGNRF